jgi:hypothetical protein
MVVSAAGIIVHNFLRHVDDGMLMAVGTANDMVLEDILPTERQLQVESKLLALRTRPARR